MAKINNSREKKPPFRKANIRPETKSNGHTGAKCALVRSIYALICALIGKNFNSKFRSLIIITKKNSIFIKDLETKNS